MEVCAAIDIRQISAAESIEAVGALLREHWEEIARNREVMVLKPNVPIYRELEDSGALVSLGAFDGDEMVGYSVTIVARHLHYADLIYAQNDVLFVSQRHRTGRLGLRLMRETERQAKARGARLMLWHAKPGSTLDVMLDRMGYGVQDIIYGKQL